MTMLQRSSLLQYIKPAIQLETDVATQEQIIQDFKGIAEFRKPKLVEQPLPAKPQVMQPDAKIVAQWKALRVVYPFLAVCGFILASTHGGTGAIIGCIAAVPLVAVAFLLEYRSYSRHMEKVDAANTANEEQYQQDVSRIKEANAAVR